MYYFQCLYVPYDKCVKVVHTFSYNSLIWYYHDVAILDDANT